MPGAGLDVLWLCEYPTLNGGEYSLLSVLAHLRAAGWRVAAAAPPAGPLADALLREGVPVLPFECHDRHGARRPRDQLRGELAALVAHQRPALLHANSLSMGRLSGPPAARLGLPSIAHLRDIVGLSPAAAADLNGHSRLLAVSAAARDWHVAQGVCAAKTQVLYNGADLARFHPAPRDEALRAELGVPPEALLAGAVGQVIRRKGWDLLAAAAGRLAGELPQLHYLLAGERYSAKAEARQFEADLRVAWEKPCLAGRVHWLGYRHDVARLLPQLDLLIHPARQEPLGRVLLEAAAAGLPIIAADVGGTREIFPGPEAAACLVAPDDPASLAAALRELAGNPAARRQLGLAARRRAVEAFDVRASAAALAEHYRQVACGET